jgi:hypothetical protein
MEILDTCYYYTVKYTTDALQIWQKGQLKKLKKLFTLLCTQMVQ